VAILQDLGENLITAGSAREALEQLLKKDIAIVLSDVCMAGRGSAAFWAWYWSLPSWSGWLAAWVLADRPRNDDDPNILTGW